jgi:membrane protease YdiL (CAAX protease family)
MAGYACAIPLYFAGAITQSIISEPNLVTNPVMPLLVSSPDALTQILLLGSVLVVAPFFEECLFRGFFYRHLRGRMGVTRATVISAAVFAAVHMSFQIFLPLFALGVVLAIVTERSGSVLPAMLVHAVFNGANALMAVAVFGS